jgi:general secretion pathway protein M
MRLSLDNLKQQFANMSVRERRMVIVGALAVVLVLVIVVILPLESGVSRAHQRVGQKQADLAWMRSVAPEIARAGPARRPSAESLLVVVDRSARESNLGTSLAGSGASGAGGLQVRFEKAPFDTLVAWLARLSQQNGVRVDSATIDSTGQPGLVNAAVVLHAR